MHISEVQVSRVELGVVSLLDAASLLPVVKSPDRVPPTSPHHTLHISSADPPTPDIIEAK